MPSFVIDLLPQAITQFLLNVKFLFFCFCKQETQLLPFYKYIPANKSQHDRKGLSSTAIYFSSTVFVFCSKTQMEKVIQEGRICIFELDTQGVEQIRKTDIHPICVFIRPRNYAILVSFLFLVCKCATKLIST